MSGNIWWTSEETDHMRNHYWAISSNALQRLLPGRSVPSIKQKAIRMGLKKSRERIKEAMRENISIRWRQRAVFATPPDIEA